MTQEDLLILMNSENKQTKKVLLHANSRTATLTNKRVLREHVATMTTNLSGDPIAVCWRDTSLRVSDVQKLQGPHSINDRIIEFYIKYLESKFQQSDMAFIAPEDAECMLNQPAWQIFPFFEALELNSKKFIFFVFADELGHEGTASSTSASSSSSSSSSSYASSNTPTTTTSKTSSNLRQHFTLVAFSRPEEAFYFYDACGKNQKDASALTLSFMSELCTVTSCKRFMFKMLRGQHLPHTNHDCGIRMLSMLEHVANHVYHFERIHDVETLHQNAVSDKRMQILTVVHKISESAKGVGKSKQP